MVNFAGTAKSMCMGHKINSKERKKNTLRYFWKIGQIHIRIYPQTSNKPKNGAFCLNNKVSVHRFSLKYRPRKYIVKIITSR